MIHRRYSKYFPLLFILLDLAGLNISFVAASYVKFGKHLLDNENYLALAGVMNLLWIFVFYSSRLYDLNREQKLGEQINRVLTTLVVNLSLVLMIWFLTKPFYFSRQQLFFTYFFFTICIVGWRTSWFYFIRYYRKKGFNIRHVAIVGYEEMAAKMIHFMKSNPALGYKLVGVFDDSEKSPVPLQGTTAELEEFVARNKVDIFFCNLNSIGKDKFQYLVHLADSNLIKVKILSQFSKLELDNVSVQNYGYIPVLNVNEIPLDNSLNQFVKRAFDILFSVLIIVGILSWLTPILTVLIKLESKGPALFKQRRHGRGNRPFDCWKFRTMVLNQQADSQQATRNDHRVTRVGAFLRRTSIDELPQFINVFLGDMSVVGPRPHPIKLNEQYQPTIEKFWHRHAVKPGLTGLAQARGFRGETDFIAMSGRVRLDRFYVRHWSLLLDLKIIFLTIAAFLKGSENAY